MPRTNPGEISMVRRCIGVLLAAWLAACGSAPNDNTDVGGTDASIDEGIDRDTAVDVGGEVDAPVPDTSVDVEDIGVDVVEDVVEDVPPPECVEGEERLYRCPDGERVPWCTCVGGEFACIDTPAAQCREISCDDGTEVTCEGSPPTCQEGELLAVLNSCWKCVNPATCVPWGEPTCEADIDCPASSYCDDCATTSCPTCDDCVAGCVDHTCRTAAEPDCLRDRPDCEVGDFAIIDDGCWTCVDRTTCQPPAPDETCAEASGVCAQPLEFCGDGFGAVPANDCAEQALCCAELPEDSCDDGQPQTCDREPPRCAEGWTVALQEGCWVCVNPATCHPWGMPTCSTDADCGPEAWCDPCGTASCSSCIDCVSACVPHECFTEVFASCECDRPDCPGGTVSVIRSGCWECVAAESCTSIGIDVCP